MSVIINLLPIDVLKLITDIYYTPIITSFEEEHRFYCVFTYPSHTIKLRIPPCDYRLGKSFSKCYLYEEVEVFIECLKQNINGKIHMTEYIDLQINLDKDYINIIYKDDINILYKSIQTDIKICNTENSREQLASALFPYIDYMIFYDSERYSY
jgi:hypothetical protein